MNYDSWKTTTPQDRQHNEDCICEMCHERHIENGLCAKLAKDHQYDCCVQQIESMVEHGDWCEKCNTDAYMKEKRCLECEFINSKDNSEK